MSDKIVYIAAPFWSENENIRNFRRRKAIEYTNKLIHKGVMCYSPLLYSDSFKETKQKEGYWLEFGKRMVACCTEVRVLCLDKWEESSGIKGELEIAEKLGIEIKYILKTNRLSFHGSRSLGCPKTKKLILSCIEKYQPETIVTHAEPRGVCQSVRNCAKQNGIPLKLHSCQGYRQAGKFHHRSVSVINDSDHCIFIHDGKSSGTANELIVAQKLGSPYSYFVFRNDEFIQLDHVDLDSKDITDNLIQDIYEKEIDEEIRKSPEYKKFRHDVLERDKHKCQVCKSEENLCVHHIIRFSKSELLSMDVSNGQTLCEDCHNGVHGKNKTRKIKQ